MHPQLTVQPQPGWTHYADWLLVPLMHIVTGTVFLRGRPQETHRWHVQPLSRDEVRQLDRSIMIKHGGDPDASPRCAFGVLPLNHIPILGGWRRFVVLQPTEPVAQWHIGWLTADRQDVNRIVLRSPVRVLIGPGKVYFFGIKADTGTQIPIKLCGAGTLWGRRHSHFPLL